MTPPSARRPAPSANASGTHFAEPQASGLRMAVVVHLFYTDQWPEFLTAFGNIRQPFRLFVSLTPESSFAPTILSTFPDAIVRPMPNVGRDVAPFLAFLPELQDFDVVCKLHTKRSEIGHRGWRQSLVDGLIGSPEVVQDYLQAFAAEPDLILAGPRSAYVDGKSHLYATARAVAAQHGALPPDWGFFAGTMFWCRPQAFAGLDEVYPQDAFVAHADRDGHPEHAVERAFGVIVSQSGKKIMLHDERPTIDTAARLRGDPYWFETYKGFQTTDTTGMDMTASAGQTGRPGLMHLHDAHDGYVSDKWTGSLRQYERIFQSLRDDPVRLLEIGVQNGGSLKLWSQYFSKGQVFVGCDIDPGCSLLAYDDARIRVIVTDAAAPVALTQVMEQSGQFDIIIDDGSHRSGDIIRSFLQFFPTLSERGIYVIEDLHCSYWPAFEGGLRYAASSLAFFRALTDIINQAHWVDRDDPLTVLHPFAAAYGIDFDPVIFQRIASIEFVNSMVIVRSGTEAERGLGRRMVRGRLALVNDEVLGLDRGKSEDLFPLGRAVPAPATGASAKRAAQ